MKKRTIKTSPKLNLRKSVVTAPRQIFQVGRNDPCPCGSGKKYKECHADQGETFLKKLAKQQQREKLKAQGVSWWKRWLFSG